MIKNNISGTSPPVKEFEMLASKNLIGNLQFCIKWKCSSRFSFTDLDLSEGDEVIMPSHTIISILSAVIRTNAKPVFVTLIQIHGI